MDSNVLAILSSRAIFGALIVILVVSYLLYALFTWSFVKPCKFIGVSSIIAGCLLLIVRFGNSFVIDSILSDVKVPGSLLAVIFKPILIMGIIYIVVGIGLIVVQNIYFKNKKTVKAKEEPKKTNNSTKKKK